MRHTNRNKLGFRVLITAATAAVAFLCGWSTGGWAIGVGLAVALGTASAVAVFHETSGRHPS